MVPYTDQFPGCVVIVRSSGLARYVSFEMSLEGLNVPLQTHIARAITSNLAGSINSIIKDTTQKFIWFIDDDHQFDNMMLLRLMSHDKPVVNGLTCMNKPPFHCVIYQGEAERGEERWAPDFRDRAAQFLRDISLDEEPLDGSMTRLLDLIRESGYRRKNRQYITYSWKMIDDKMGLFPIYACGLAGMLVKREVFDALSEPW